jgi:signal-transduction protein with cAMP-binding, CBS, and nucleotidyltransferase domain
MLAGDICVRRVRTIRSDSTVIDAARRMCEEGVGSLVVVGRQGPVEGVLTDRDIVVRWAAAEGHEDSTPVGHVMTRGIVAVSDRTSLEDALETMAERSVRRLVVTNEVGDLVGILALDDILEMLGHETEAIIRVLHRPVPA